MIEPKTDRLTVSTPAILEAARALKRSRRLLIGTAAGLSADSGIPTYRRAGESAWQNYGVFESLGLRAEDHACPKAFEEEPERAWAFLEWKRRGMAAAEPHEGYRVLNRLGEGRESFIQTSNVDGFHIRSGWPAERLHELHGSLWRFQCCGRFWTDDRVPLVELDERNLQATGLPECEGCGRAPRPHALLFADLEYIGDPTAEQRRREFKAARPDVFLVVGESGVIPTHSHDATVLKAADPGLIVININPDASCKAARVADINLVGGAREALVAIEAALAGS